LGRILRLLTPVRPSSSSSPHLSLSSAASRCFAGAITLPLARPRRPIVGLGQRFSHLRLRYFGLGSIWGGVKRGERFPPRAHAWPAVSSSSPHLSLFSAAPRCFTGATTLLSAVPVVLFTSGCGSVCLRTLVLLGASFCNLVTTTSCRAGLNALSSTRRAAACPLLRVVRRPST